MGKLISNSPFSQRVWIALEAKGIAYQYCEINPYNRPAPAAFLEGNPGGRVPTIRQGDWTCAESSIILEYVSPLSS
jgi:glutathione S-transferase